MTPSDTQLKTEIDLRSLNTLGVSAKAAWFVRLAQKGDLPYWLSWARERALPVLILGGGSNLVLARDFPGLVIQMGLKGRCWESVSQESAILDVAAGENWHDTVMYSVDAGYGGLENLALIPGTVGAAPIQNIGAYGAELAEVLASVDVFDIQVGEWRRLTRQECRFGYRDSLFKQEPGRYVITGVRLSLSRQRPLNVAYRDLQQYFAQLQREPSSLSGADVARAVIAIRHDKLPDPTRLPNVGSFFKNPVVSQAYYEKLHGSFPGLVSYPDTGGVKLAAGWMIDQCGWKGYRNAHVGVHARQALVLINHANGSGQDILDLARAIQADVEKTFGVMLEIEPLVIGGEAP